MMKINGAIKTVQKRDGRIVAFESEKISFAVFKAKILLARPTEFWLIKLQKV